MTTTIIPKGPPSKRASAALAREEHLRWLRARLAPGDTVTTILRHVSRSGMFRCVSPIIDGQDVSYRVGPVIGYTIDQKHGGLRVPGCGTDVGFEVVHSLAYKLWPDGFGCIGERCPSNDHSNGDHDRTPHCSVHRTIDHSAASPARPRCDGDHWHRSGAYAIRQRWL